MRKASFFLATALLLGAGAAEAETRIFVIDNSDAYGVDRCLANGEPCGEQFAAAWCRTHNYERALDFGRVASADTTASIASSPVAAAPCAGDHCRPVVAITCSR